MKQFRRLDTVEARFGLPRQMVEPPDDVATHPRESPREALEAILKPALLGPATCYVLFSGGRDSSAVLAVAVALARRLGANAPHPVTYVHPDAPGSDEAEWQALVLQHLGISSRTILRFRGEQAWLGDVATQSLRDHGLVWPPSIHLHGAIYRQLDAGATLVSGEGGDLAIEGRRITPLVRAVRAMRPRASVRELRAILRSDSNEFIEGLADRCGWLTIVGRERFLDTYASGPSPLRWDRDLFQAAFSRITVLAGDNFRAQVESYGLTPLNPLEEPRFIAALMRRGGMLGMGDRTDMMRALFADLLPDAVLARTSKAYFNESRWTDTERAFARDWQGAGVDAEYNDHDLLRQEWLSEAPFTLSAFHLHAAWFASHGLTLATDGS